METDENSQIINLVRNRPVLFSKCNDFRDRNHHWKEIADILKVDVSWIKSRWHILRAKFLTEYSAELKGRRSNFKYFNELSFLINHINIEVFDMHRRTNELETQPEFIITEKDLDENSDDDSNSIFVELDIESNSNKDTVQTFDLSGDISNDGLAETLSIPNEFSQSKQIATETKYKLTPQVENVQVYEIKENNHTRIGLKDDTGCTEKPSEENKPVSEELEKFKVAVPENKQSVDKLCEQTELNQLSISKSDKHRCEDTIFGELVTATLRRMQSEKKKAVKREIMNILFT